MTFIVILTPMQIGGMISKRGLGCFWILRKKLVKK